MFDFLIPIVAVVSVFGSASWIVWVITDALRQRNQLRVASEFHSKLLDRLSSARDFADFLNTEGGVRFLNSLSGGGPKAPQTRIVRAIVSGIVMLVLGLSMFLFVWLNPTIWSDAQSSVNFMATIAVALGLGLIVASGVAYRLSRHMGLFDADEKTDRPVTPSA